MARVFGGPLEQRHAGSGDYRIQWTVVDRYGKGTSANRRGPRNGTLSATRLWTLGNRDHHRRSEGVHQALDGQGAGQAAAGYRSDRNLLREREGPAAQTVVVAPHTPSAA